MKKRNDDHLTLENGLPLDADLPGVIGRTLASARIVRRLAVKKLDPALRKPKPGYPQERGWYRRTLLRLQEDPQFFRSAVQAAFVLLCIWIGIEFMLFTRWGTSGGHAPYFDRPPGAEGFLPISALMSLKYWLTTGIINSVHPSGLFIFLAVLAVSVLLKKAFCSWLCPVGTLSESLWMLGKKLFGRNLMPPRWLDYPLRSLKYLILLFFGLSVLQMEVPDLKMFIYSPYNKVADIKMYLFFAEIGTFALWTIIVLMLFSVVVKNFWCRYLCPYGALLGAASWLSPLKITRNASTCIDCELCTKACPSNVKVHTARRVWSDECMNCLECVQACPVKETLDVRMSVTNTRVPNWVVGSLVLGVFVGITGLAVLTGHWHNKISREEYLRHFQQMESPMYQHNRGSVPEYDETQP
jgi:polyferredoxin